MPLAWFFYYRIVLRGVIAHVLHVEKKHEIPTFVQENKQSLKSRERHLSLLQQCFSRKISSQMVSLNIFLTSSTPQRRGPCTRCPYLPFQIIMKNSRKVRLDDGYFSCAQRLRLATLWETESVKLKACICYVAVDCCVIWLRQVRSDVKVVTILHNNVFLRHWWVGDLGFLYT